jgi:zinc transporter 5/7
MFVEVIYGLISNSLGLLTDGAHMLLDSSAVIIGLYSTYLSDFKENGSFNFGYARSEVIGTFINSVFLVFIALYIVFESIERFLQPKEIHSEHLILVSFLGLLVNILGIYFLHGADGLSHHGCDGHGHSHSHSHNHSDNKAHKHSDDKSHSHSHSHNSCSHSQSNGHHEHNHSHTHDHSHTTTDSQALHIHDVEAGQHKHKKAKSIYYIT